MWYLFTVSGLVFRYPFNFMHFFITVDQRDTIIWKGPGSTNMMVKRYINCWIKKFQRLLGKHWTLLLVHMALDSSVSRVLHAEKSYILNSSVQYSVYSIICIVYSVVIYSCHGFVSFKDNVHNIIYQINHVQWLWNNIDTECHKTKYICICLA